MMAVNRGGRNGSTRAPCPDWVILGLASGSAPRQSTRPVGEGGPYERRYLGAAACISRRRRFHGPESRGARLRVVLVRRASVHSRAFGEPLPRLGGRRHSRELFAFH